MSNDRRNRRRLQEDRINEIVNRQVVIAPSAATTDVQIVWADLEAGVVTTSCSLGQSYVEVACGAGEVDDTFLADAVQDAVYRIAAHGQFIASFDLKVSVVKVKMGVECVVIVVDGVDAPSLAVRALSPESALALLEARFAE